MQNKESLVKSTCRTFIKIYKVLLAVIRNITDWINRILKNLRIVVMILKTEWNRFDDRIGLKLSKEKLRSFSEVANQVQCFLFQVLSVVFS